MIVKMKKLTLLCTRSQQEETLNILRDLGVVHIEHTQPPQSTELETAKSHLQHVQRVKEVLTAHEETEPTGKNRHQLIDKVWKLIHEEKELNDTLQSLKHEETRIEPFGDFNPQQIEQLIESGVHIKLYEFSIKTPPEISDNISISEISRNSSTIYLMAAARSEFSLNGHEVRLPDLSLSDIRHHIEKTKTALKENQKMFRHYGGDLKIAEEIVSEAEDDVSYYEVKSGMGLDSPVAYLNGYIPIDVEERLVEKAKACGWGYVIKDVSDNDTPPTLLRNPKWVKPIQAALDVIAVVPGYKELDVSALFLIFLSIFFAFIIGDAGYGILFMALTLLGKKKAKGKEEAQPALNLLMIMSVATIVFGALTGNYFGIPIDVLPKPLALLTSPYMTGWTGSEWNSDLAAKNIMFICFSIAAIHLSIAHIWNLIRKINSSAALIDLGWLCCTWSLYTIVLELVISVHLYSFVKSMNVPLLIFGIICVAIGLLLQKSYIGIITLLLDVISNFVDIISYIRLYAVGAASLAVAQAFNEMAIGVGFHGLASIGAALILFAGHALNIVLGAMGVMVHGIRLNTLEFSGHAGVEWAGIHFNPFRKTGNKV